ncbi:hypothetical protein St703_11110 [Sporolactobacillus terrae]|uniref:EamA domain-containing protein n=1 Tax=Sporolactobacillus terrae TaxID=269673 RepID=A0A5K7X3F3_9BACL|nr:hypothetical protein St703_11110 [Sporolactobacillus terrae]
MVAIIGSLIIAWGDIGISGQALLGDLLSFLGAAALAAHLLIGQGLMKKISGQSYSFVVFLVSGLALLIFNLTTGVEIYHYSLKNWSIFILLALVSTVFGHMLFNMCLKYIDATMVSMSAVAEPVIASLLALVLLNEKLIALQLIGGFITLAGIAIYFINPHQKTKKSTRR